MQVLKQIGGLTSKVLFALAAVFSVFLILFLILAFFLFSWISQSFQVRLNLPNPADIINQSQDFIQVTPTTQSSSSDSSDARSVGQSGSDSLMRENQPMTPTLWESFGGEIEENPSEAED